MKLKKYVFHKEEGITLRDVVEVYKLSPEEGKRVLKQWYWGKKKALLMSFLDISASRESLGLIFASFKGSRVREALSEVVNELLSDPIGVLEIEGKEGLSILVSVLKEGVGDYALLVNNFLPVLLLSPREDAPKVLMDLLSLPRVQALLLLRKKFFLDLLGEAPAPNAVPVIEFFLKKWDYLSQNQKEQLVMVVEGIVKLYETSSKEA